MKSICIDGKKYVNRWEIKTFGQACDIASVASSDLGRSCIPIDRGTWTSPRYDVVEFVRVGDPVSYAFNGDSYPCGHVIRISETKKVITAKNEHGNEFRFYRTREDSDCWIMKGGTWRLCAGHIESYNREF